MGWRGKRAGTAAALLAVLALGLSTCGGKDSSSKPATSADGGSTAATGPRGSIGATGASGTTGTKRSKPSGGSRAPSTRSPAPPSTNAKRPSRKQPSKKAVPEFNPNKPTAGELANLYLQSREICRGLTLQGLAHEYEVAATPDAVAKAYSKALTGKRHKAVYQGCKDGVS
jgi:hypothetical protein